MCLTKLLTNGPLKKDAAPGVSTLSLRVGNVLTVILHLISQEESVSVQFVQHQKRENEIYHYLHPHQHPLLPVSMFLYYPISSSFSSSLPLNIPALLVSQISLKIFSRLQKRFLNTNIPFTEKILQKRYTGFKLITMTLHTSHFTRHNC
jgi:hypothetical protein